MASSVAKIYQQLLAMKNSLSQLAALNSSSHVSIWNLWLWNTAAGQATFEQLSDQAQANIETIIAGAPVFSLAWIAQQCLNFQYSSSSPQYLQLNISNQYPFFTFSYPVVNPALNVITQAAAITNNSGQVIIKVAGNSAPLTGVQKLALQSYLNIILPPNVQYTLISDYADLMLIQGNIYYDAAYSGVIQTAMNTAITSYMSTLPFNGIFTVSALEEVMLNVPGVKDVVLSNVYWRKATDPAPSGGPPPTNMPYKLINNQTLISRSYQTYAGYVIPETTANYTLNDLLTYTPQ